MNKKFQNSFFDNHNKYSAKVLSRKFHLNGYIIVHLQNVTLNWESSQHNLDKLFRVKG